MVIVLLSLGYDGRQGLSKAYRPYATLQNRSLEVDLDKSWRDEIWRAFRVDLDENEVDIRRKGSAAAGRKFPRREITEVTGNLITEDFSYATSEGRYTVVILLKKFERDRDLGSPILTPTSSARTRSNGMVGARYSRTQVPPRAAMLLKATWSLSGKNIPPELEPLHDVQIEVETDKTWLQALSDLEVSLDPERYFVRKYRTDNVRSKSEYDLRQPIKWFLKDVQYLGHREQFTRVLFIDRKTVKVKVDNRKTTTRNSAAAAAATVTVRQPMGTPNFQLAAGTARIIQQGGQNTGNSARAITKTANTAHLQLQPQRPMATATAIATTLGNAVVSPPPQKQQRMEVYSKDSIGRGYGSSRNHEDDDGKSVVQKQGIPLQNIRELVYAAAEKMTNRDLVVVRNELLELREGAKSSQTGKDRWMEWNTTCPFPATILRTLFDV